MRCPKCGCEESKVVDSRPSESNDAIRRRRECVKCGYRFTTYERREEMPLLVVKKDGRKETFDRQKLMRGLLAATVKRSVPVEALDGLIDDIESELRDEGMNEVSSHDLGSMVLKRLVNVDKVAYIRFASVYRDFKDVDEFSEELRSLNFPSSGLTQQLSSQPMRMRVMPVSICAPTRTLRSHLLSAGSLVLVSPLPSPRDMRDLFSPEAVLLCVRGCPWLIRLVS